MRKWMIMLSLVMLSLWAPQVKAQPQAPQGKALALNDSKMVTAGKRLYRRRCVFCHGTKGKGDGQVSRYVFPKPRDLSLGLFKIRSTPTGSLPTDQDLFDTLTRGLPGTTMPSWVILTEAQRWQLVAYIKTLSRRFEREQPLEPISIGPPKPPYPESVMNGRRLYVEAECWTCHGMWGKGDGPSSATLIDDWGYPIVPADLSVSSNWRGGNRPEDIFRSISVGIGGTPMPSWRDALSEEQIWDLTNYLLSVFQR